MAVKPATSRVVIVIGLIISLWVAFWLNEIQDHCLMDDNLESGILDQHLQGGHSPLTILGHCLLAGLVLDCNIRAGLLQSWLLEQFPMKVVSKVSEADFGTSPYECSQRIQLY